MNRWYAAFFFLTSSISTLLAQQVTQTDNPLSIALEKACEDGKLDQVKAMIEQQNAPVNVQTGDLGMTPVMGAAYGGNADVLTYLVSKGANLNFPDHEGSTPLLHACWEDHADCALALIAAGARVNFSSNAGRSPLMYASMHGDDAVVSALIAQKAKLDANCTEGPAVLWAAANDKLSTVMLLGAAGAKLALAPEWGDPKKNTVLANAAAYNDEKMIDYLLQHGVDVNLPNGDGTTPLMVAARYQWDDAVQQFLTAGAKVDLQNADGDTALTLAQDSNIVQALLSKHAALEPKNKKGMTALIAAAYREDIESVRALVEAGANINAADLRGETALTLAGDTGMESIADYLRQKGAKRTDIHIIDKGPPPQPLYPPQLWALAVNAIYSQRDALNPKVLGGGVTEPESEKVRLQRDWGVTDQTSLTTQLDELRDSGHHTEYREQGQQLAKMSTADFNQLLATQPGNVAHLQLLKASYDKWQDRTGLAWDLCRSARLVNSGFTLGYISEQDAWKRLIAIAQVAQANFSSWQEMNDNFLDGREIWANNRDAQLEACTKLLTNPKDPNSPWNQNPWKTDLSTPFPSSN